MPEKEKPREYVTAAASRDTAPRVGLIPSNFAGSKEFDGKVIRALARPAALDAELSAAQLDDMLRLTVELGGGRRGGLVTAIAADDWVVIKTSWQECAAHEGSRTDPRLVSGVLRYLLERGLGRRFSILEGAPCVEEYAAMAADLAKKHAGRRFEVIDANKAPTLEMPVEGRVFASRNPKGMYHVPRVIRECDKVIAIAPLATSGLSVMSYLGFAPVDRAAGLGDPDEVAVDLFSFHPADYAIVGGTFASDGGGRRRHNVIVAGTNAPAVDAVGYAVMGFDSTTIKHLDLAVKQGYGVNDAYSIWTRGAEIDEAKAEFKRA